MLYLGAALVLFGAYTVWRKYSEFLSMDLAQCRAFVRAFSDYREKIKCYMDTPMVWANGYSDATIGESVFIDRLKDGESFRDAYAAFRESFSLTENVDRILFNCFDRLGEGYLDTELEALEMAIDKLTGEEEALSDGLYKRRKAFGAVVGAFAVGVIILII